MLRQFRTGFKVIATAHHQVMRTGVVGLKLIGFGIEEVCGLVRIRGWPVGKVAITIIEVSQQDAGAIGGLPGEQRGGAFWHTAPKAGGIHVKAVEDLR